MFTNPYERKYAGWGGIPDAYLYFIQDLPEEERYSDNTYIKYLEYCGCFEDPQNQGYIPSELKHIVAGHDDDDLPF